MRGIELLLDTNELLKLEDAVRQRLATDLTRMLCEFNRAGELDEALTKWGMGDLLHPDNGYQPYKDGKILVIGDSQVKKEHLLEVEGMGLWGAEPTMNAKYFHSFLD